MTRNAPSTNRLHIASESIIAIVQQPVRYSLTMLATDLKAQRSVVSHGLEILHQNGWIESEKHFSGNSGRPRNLLSATSKFRKDRVKVYHSLLDEMIREDIDLFDDATKAARNDETDTVGKAKQKRALLIGSCAVLAEIYDPADHGTWLKGEYGWRALIRTSE